MRFYLGVHRAHWLATAGVPLFVSRRVLKDRRTLPVAAARWALDSGGFTELNLHGRWETSEDEYVRDVLRFEREIGSLDWVAPMDWMCEPFVLQRTGLTVDEHIERTVQNFLRLRDDLGSLVIPVLQGWTLADYLICASAYYAYGIDLADERVVGVGTVCRRQNTAEAGRVLRGLAAEGWQLHAFGVKKTGLFSFSDALASADSMAWSYRARRGGQLPGCVHKSCTNCLPFALRWRDDLVQQLGQQRLEVAA